MERKRRNKKDYKYVDYGICAREGQAFHIIVCHDCGEKKKVTTKHYYRCGDCQATLNKTDLGDYWQAWGVQNV